MALVLLHGFTHTGASWDPVVAALGGRYRVLAPDIRGHGSRSALEPVTLDAVIQDIDALMPFGEQAVLVGYSMGGRLALHIALALGPERVARLVLIGASPGLADRDERLARRAADETLADEIERLAIEEVAEKWASSTAVLADQPASVRAAVHLDRLRNTPAGLARALRGLGTGALPSLWDRLGELAMPVELVVGERDVKFAEIGTRMAALLPAARLEIVGGCGHAVHLEDPEAIAEVLGVRS